MNPMMESIIAEVIGGLIVAAVTGIMALFLGNHFISLYENARKLREYGVSKLRDSGVFLDKELIHIFSKATKIKIYYTSGRGFFKKNERRIRKMKQKKPACEIQVILGNKNNPFIQQVTEAEMDSGKRRKDEKGNNISIETEIEEVSKMLDDLGVEYKYDPGMFFLPYIIVQFGEDETMAYLNLTIPPVPAMESMMIISNKKKDETGRNMVSQLEAHFDYAWSVLSNDCSKEEAGE